MIIDHVGAFIPDMPIWTRYIGRFFAPIFFFCMAWGMDYTKSRKLYLLRLYAASLCMGLVTTFLSAFVGGTGGTNPELKNNIFSTLFVTAAIIALLFPEEQGKRLKGILFLLAWQLSSTAIIIGMILLQMDEYTVAVLTGNIFFCEGGVRWVILGVLIYCIKNSPKKLAIGYSLYCVVYEAVAATAIFSRLIYNNEGYVSERVLSVCKVAYYFIMQENYFQTPLTPHRLNFTDYQWMMIGALPFMLVYNHKLGKKCRWFFYLFYPLHIILFILIGKHMGN